MDIDIDGISYDLQDPRKRAEAIRRWLKKKAEKKNFTLPPIPLEEGRDRGETPIRPFAPLKG